MLHFLQNREGCMECSMLCGQYFDGDVFLTENFKGQGVQAEIPAGWSSGEATAEKTEIGEDRHVTD